MKNVFTKLFYLPVMIIFFVNFAYSQDNPNCFTTTGSVYLCQPQKYVIESTNRVITNILYGTKVNNGIANMVVTANGLTTINAKLDDNNRPIPTTGISVGTIPLGSRIELTVTWFQSGPQSFVVNFGTGGNGNTEAHTDSFSCTSPANYVTCQNSVHFGRCLDCAPPPFYPAPTPIFIPTGGFPLPVFGLVNALKNESNSNLVYPSISSSEIQIAEFSNIKSIRVIDLLGNIKKQIELPEDSNNLKINVSNYTNGMYLVQLLSNQGEVSTQKFQVIHE